MNREEAKELLSVIQAFAEGKTIEMYLECDNKWKTCFNPAFNPENKYRIKPEPKYRPFNSKEECWNEMLKHKPFGWVTDGDCNYCVSVIYDEDAYFDVYIGNTRFHFDEAFTRFTFIDSTPF